MLHNLPDRKITMVFNGVTLGRLNAFAAPNKKQTSKKAVNPEEVLPLDEKEFEDF